MKTFNNSLVSKMKLFCIVLVLVVSSIQLGIAQADSLLLTLGLSDFRGESKGLSIELSWAWVNPLDEKDFVIERAGADGLFEPIGNATNESFVDHHPTEKVHYYRLLSYDLYGQELYSRIIAIEHELKKETQIVPNPATRFIEVGFHMQGKSAAVIILDHQGNAIHQENVEAPLGGMQQVHIDLENYNAGVYILRIVDGVDGETKQFVVL